MPVVAAPGDRSRRMATKLKASLAYIMRSRLVRST